MINEGLITEASNRIKLHKNRELSWINKKSSLQTDLSELLGQKAAWSLCRTEMEKQINKLRKQISDIKGVVDTPAIQSIVLESPKQTPIINENVVSTPPPASSVSPIVNIDKPKVETPKKAKKGKKASSGKPAVLKHSVTFHLDSIRAICFYPNLPVLVSASDDGTIRLTNLEPVSSSGKKLRNPVNFCSLRGHSAPVLTLAPYENKGKPFMISGALDGTVAIWDLPGIDASLYDVRGTVTHDRALEYRFHKDSVWCVHTDSVYGLSVSSDGTAKHWKISDDPQPFDLPIKGNPISCRFFAENRFVIASYEGTIYEFNGHNLIKEFNIGSTITSMSEAVEIPYIYITTDDGRVRVINIEEASVSEEFVVNLKGVTSACVTSDAECIVTTGIDKEVRVWSTDGFGILFSEAIHREKFGESAICSCATSKVFPRSYFATGGAEGTVHIFSHNG